MALLTGFYRRCGVLGLIALGFLFLGSLAFVRAVANRGGLTMDCATFLAQKPNAKWVALSDCVVSRILSVPKTTVGGKPTEVYVPIRAASGKPNREIQLLLASSEASDLDFVTKANEQSSMHSGRGTFRSSYAGQVEETRNLEGRMVRGLQLADRDRAKLTKTFPTLAQDFVIIEAKPRPGFALPITLILIGAAGLGFHAFPILKRRLTSPTTFADEGVVAAAK